MVVHLLKCTYSICEKTGFVKRIFEKAQKKKGAFAVRYRAKRSTAWLNPLSELNYKRKNGNCQEVFEKAQKKEVKALGYVPPTLTCHHFSTQYCYCIYNICEKSEVVKRIFEKRGKTNETK